MISPLHAYYLKQMDIEPYVRRSLSSFRVFAVHEVKCIVLLANTKTDEKNRWVFGEEGELLMQILRSIGLSAANTVLIFDQKGACNAEREAFILECIERHAPKCMLVFDGLTTHCNRLPVVCIESLAELRAKPGMKRHVFQALWALQ